MSAIPAPFSPDTGPDTGHEQAWLRPGWLRPAALAAGLSLNLAAALLIGRARVETPQILPSIEVSLVTTPYVPPPAAQPEVAAPETVPPEPAPLAAPEPEVTPPPTIIEPPVAAPAEPPPLVDPAIERRKAEEAEKRRQERALELREAKKRQELEVRQAQARREAQEKAKDAAKARQAAAEKGAQAQRQKISGESRAAYGGVVVAEIQRRRPVGAARAGGATGQVGVTFTVGASGRIVSHRLDSSPDPRLAAAVGAIMAAVHAPPPPGGSFTAHTSLNFSAR